MPPTSKTLFEEGAQIKSFKLVNKGEFQHDELVRYMVEEPAKSAALHFMCRRGKADFWADMKAALALAACRMWNRIFEHR